MGQFEIMRARHSVRQFIDKPLAADAVEKLRAEIDTCNREGGMHIQLITDEPEAFQAGKTSYGQFKCCKNYLAIVGTKDKDVEAGYYGERVVLKAQELGINSCWVALTYKKGKARYVVEAGEKLYLEDDLLAQVSDYKDGDPEWYKNGVEAALLAPTAINQQKFRFERNGDRVRAKVAGFGFYSKIDLGIVKYHFEIGSGKGKNVWA